MREIRLGLMAIIVCLFTTNLSAQTYSRGREDKKAEINFTELAQYYKDHPTPEPRRLPFEEAENEDEDAVKPPPANPSLVHKINRTAAREAGGDHTTSYLPITPAPADTFQATLSNGSYIPPDTHGAVDSNYCVTAINSSVHIQKRNGANVSNVSLDNFWTSMLASGGGSFDPRIHFDHLSKRWVIVTFAYGQTANSQIMIGVSKTSNPTMGWYLYKVVVGTATTWLDYPNVGINNKWITVTGNVFKTSTSAFTTAAMYVFDKAQLMAGTGAPYTKITTNGFTLCPSIDYDGFTNSMFVIDVYDNSTGDLRIRKLTGPVGAPVLSADIGYPNPGFGWSSSGPSGNDFAAQVGSVQKMDCGDNRITNFTLRNNKLWCSHSIFLPKGAPTRCSALWWQIDTTANPAQVGLLDDPTAPTFYAYSSIAVNKNNDAIMGFSYMNRNVHPCAAYTLHLHTDPVDSMRPARIYRHGLNTYFQNFGSGKNRWGDYSGTCVDPLNDYDFWTIQESVPATVNLWDTWWAHISLSTATSLSVNSAEVQAQAVKVIPNPNNGAFDLSFANSTKDPVVVKLNDMEGRNVYDRTFYFINNNKVSIETTNLTAGMYIAKIYIDGQVISQKVTITR